MLVTDRSLPSARRPSSRVVPAGAPPLSGWRRALSRAVLQHPLVETRLSLEGLASLPKRPPGGLMIGIGLCTERRLSAGLPLDVLGLLLPAEALRQALGAPKIVVLVADVHARLNRLGAGVEARAAEAVRTLERARRHLPLPALEVVRASELHESAAYRAVLGEVERHAPEEERPYVKRQIADVAYFAEKLGGVLKVGWCISPSSRARHEQDERYFDARHQAILGGGAGFVYCKPGRVLDDARRKAPPYVTLDASRRVRLAPDEDVSRKLGAATRFASAPTVNGVRKHLRAVTRAFCELSEEPLSGSVEARAQALIRRVFG